MIFVGREKEKKKIIKELQRGKNIVLSGKFGIGRTSLVKKIAEQLGKQRQFVFVDFGQTPGKMSKKLMKELCIDPRFKTTGKKMGYRSMRYRISTIGSSTKSKFIIVFDNVAKLTPQKIIFLRHLVEEDHFQFIAIAENFLPGEDVLLLMAQLIPMETVSLHHLSTKDISAFIRHYAEKHHINLSDSYIDKLTALASGYPLGMIDLIKSVMNK
ncbi:MAG: hypothetical protein CVU43_19155 [Chloroflexi bacterium HGW-Chloroflexi-5]|nr:MAG: hypothetical protein CVU43_19155 [Chloroflexi bacterium HGW-Chloroflexi-5]